MKKYYAHKDCGTFTVTYTPSYWQEDGNGGGHRVYEEPQKRQVRLFIDMDAIVKQLGQRALKSKSGRAKYLSGAVIVSA